MYCNDTKLMKIHIRPKHQNKFATVVRNHSAGTQSLAAAPEGWSPRNKPQNMLLCSSEP